MKTPHCPPLVAGLRTQPALRFVRRNLSTLLVLGLASAIPLLAQSPWEQTATRMGDVFSGPVARGFSLVALVVGGLSLAFSESGGKRAIGGLVFGLGMALGATQFMTWLFV